MKWRRNLLLWREGYHLHFFVLSPPCPGIQVYLFSGRSASDRILLSLDTKQIKTTLKNVHNFWIGSERIVEAVWIDIFWNLILIKLHKMQDFNWINDVNFQILTFPWIFFFIMKYCNQSLISGGNNNIREINQKKILRNMKHQVLWVNFLYTYFVHRFQI